MSMSEELERLNNLHIEGALTDAEYAEAKAGLLAQHRRDRRHSNDGKVDRLDPVDEEKETRQWALLLHLSMLAGYVVPLGGLVAPIVIWQMKKEELPEIDEHGKHAVNWMISHIIYILISIPLLFIFVGFVTLIAVMIMGVVFPIVAAVKGNDGKVWRYPLSITFLK